MVLCWIDQQNNCDHILVITRVLQLLCFSVGACVGVCSHEWVKILMENFNSLESKYHIGPPAPNVSPTPAGSFISNKQAFVSFDTPLSIPDFHAWSVMKSQFNCDIMAFGLLEASFSIQTVQFLFLLPIQDHPSKSWLSLHHSRTYSLTYNTPTCINSLFTGTMSAKVEVSIILY